MHSDWKSIGGDVVLDSSNMEVRGEESILDQIYEKQLFLDLYYADFKYDQCFKKMHN